MDGFSHLRIHELRGLGWKTWVLKIQSGERHLRIFNTLSKWHCTGSRLSKMALTRALAQGPGTSLLMLFTFLLMRSHSTGKGFRTSDNYHQYFHNTCDCPGANPLNNQSSFTHPGINEAGPMTIMPTPSSPNSSPFKRSLALAALC